MTGVDFVGLVDARDPAEVARAHGAAGADTVRFNSAVANPDGVAEAADHVVSHPVCHNPATETV